MQIAALGHQWSNQVLYIECSPFRFLSPGSSFLSHNDVKLTGKSRQGVGEGGYVLWQLDYMSTVGILSMW